MARKGIDPITLEVLWSRFIAIAEEAAREIIRTAFSTTVRESHNFAVVILYPKGGAISQAGWALPSYVGALPLAARALLKIFPSESFGPDDLILTND
ncbi:MAG: hydantoinase B/oxoprolinase family protein, partial [bacterium]